MAEVREGKFRLTPDSPVRVGLGYGGCHDGALVWDLHKKGYDINQIVDAYRHAYPRDYVSERYRRKYPFTKGLLPEMSKEMVLYILRRLGVIITSPQRSIQHDETWGVLSTRAINALVWMGFTCPDDLPKASIDFKKFELNLRRQPNVGDITIEEIRNRFKIIKDDDPSVTSLKIAQFTDQELLNEIARRMGKS